MKTKQTFIVLISLIIGSSCTTRKDLNQDLVFSREDFMETKELNNPKKIIIDSLLNPANFRVVRDSILVVVNQQNCNYLFELYSLNTLNPILQLAPKGNGPEDMLSCATCINSGNIVDFYLQDYNKNEFCKVNLDTMLIKKKLQPSEKFKYSSEILETTDVCISDDKRYIAYNMWYLDKIGRASCRERV